ncbi:MAG: TolB family protein, partial [Anaerolineae bacterium]
DYLIFRACNYWQPGGGGQCAVWRTPSWSTVAGDGYIRPNPVSNLNAIPTDTAGTTLLLMSQTSGNWEVYKTSITGGEPVNLTNNPTQDGLGTLSPDGQWVAFVSDRSGNWAVWVVPVSGGQASKLFDLPPAPWGAGDHDWTRERISWGP